MRPRIPICRINFLRPFRPPNPRPFTQNSATLTYRSRPQLPFLSPSNRRPKARFLTTETKQWIKSEFILAGKYTAVIWTSTFLLVVLYFGVQQEWLERKYPTPPEWSWVTRKDYKTARWSEDWDEDEDAPIDWSNTGQIYRNILRRMEDPKLDGAGLQEQDEGGILVAGVGRTGFDIMGKSEPWRRGYYEILMGTARSAEHLDGYMLDTTRNTAFPPQVVIGPSYPNPRPCPPGAAFAPREEDCVPAFEPPETYYMRILTTKGFTEKQRLDAALAYAAWLEYKGTPDTALEMYKWALDIVKESSSSTQPVIEASTGILNVGSGPPSANILSATTALAVHHAKNSNLSLALPIFLSILRARRSLPDPSPTMRSTLTPDEEDTSFTTRATALIKSTMVAPPYPPPPDDGTAPPMRTSNERCEEGAIMTYIGEILYASQPTRNSREDGLAWTREAVDIAEEQLRRKNIDGDSKKTCKRCLEVGFGNWMTMVNTMAKEERQARSTQGASWLGFGGDSQKDAVGRWESEQLVIKERMRRAGEYLGSSNLGAF